MRFFQLAKHWLMINRRGSKLAFWLILITGFVSLLSGEAQSKAIRSRPLENSPSIGSAYIKDYFKQTASIAASPLSWKGATWTKAIAATALVAGVGSNEGKIQKWVQSNRSETSNRIAKIVKPVGDIHYTFPALMLLYAYGMAADDSQSRSTALVALQSAVVAGVFTETLKHLTHKHRPASTESDAAVWDGPSLKKQNLSFPSGHAAHSFAIATVFAKQYSDSKLMPVVAYTLALTCSASRINDNQHWATDVIAGALIGHVVARKIFNSYAVQYQDHEPISEEIEINRHGVSILLRF